MAKLILNCKCFTFFEKFENCKQTRISSKLAQQMASSFCACAHWVYKIVQAEEGEREHTQHTAHAVRFARFCPSHRLCFLSFDFFFAWAQTFEFFGPSCFKFARFEYAAVFTDNQRGWQATTKPRNLSIRINITTTSTNIGKWHYHVIVACTCVIILFLRSPVGMLLLRRRWQNLSKRIISWPRRNGVRLACRWRPAGSTTWYTSPSHTSCCFVVRSRRRPAKRSNTKRKRRWSKTTSNTSDQQFERR